MTAGSPIDVLGLTGAAFTVAAAPLVPRDEAIVLYRRIFRSGITPPAWAKLPEMPVQRIASEGATRKIVQRLADGLETESMILPQRSRTGRPRTTLCLSSQVGCAMGCTFCETAQMGLMRHLTPAEIVAQWHTARFELGTAIDNVVFMGMGEPLDNLDAVVPAIRVLTGHDGPAVPASRITVSTVGHPEGMTRLAALARERGFRQLRLAVSLNAPSDAIRARIMPINRRAPMEALRDAMVAWSGPTRARILIGYVLIPGVNDRADHADALSSYLAPIPCTVNVIPYNPRRDSPWPAPAEAAVDAFVERLRARGVFVKRRLTMGRSVMGACGQLGNAGIRRRRFGPVTAPTG